MKKFFRYSAAIALCAFAASVLVGCDEKTEIVGGGKIDLAVDLTPGTGYANSFMVSGAGEYKFAAKKVDGSDVAQIGKADWLWSSKNADGKGLLSDVSYAEGYIRFTAAAGKGNAVIAAVDAKGAILWNWHIWLTDTPAEVKYDEAAVFMDRDLGALSGSEADGTLTYGLKYQWGRKDPFFAGDSNETDETAFALAIAGTVVNEGIGSSEKWHAEQGDTQNGTVDYASKHPMTFIYYNTNNTNKDWLAEQDDTLWGDGTAKSNYDPCPAGWRVPRQEDWGDLGYWNVDDNEDHTGKVFTTEEEVVVWYPFNGTRWGDKGAGYLGYVGAWGTAGWWQRNPSGVNGGQFYVMAGSYASPKYAMYRAHGCSVRCVKDVE